MSRTPLGDLRHLQANPYVVHQAIRPARRGRNGPLWVGSSHWCQKTWAIRYCVLPKKIRLELWEKRLRWKAERLIRRVYIRREGR